MEIAALLRSKNESLARLLKVSADFLAAAGQGDFATLAAFQGRRAAHFRAVQFFDQKLEEVAAAVPAHARTPELIHAVRLGLAEQSVLLEEIAGVDAKIAEAIVGEQARIQQELNVSRKAASVLRKFKSTWLAEAGEGLDATL